MTPYSAIASNKRRSAFFVAAFLVLVLAIGVLWDQIEGGGTAIVPFAVLFASVSALTGYFAGDRMALAANGASPVTKEQAPEFYRIVENLAITAGLPLPRIHVIPSPAINAFATGRNPAHASIAVTTGALEKLERAELEGVIAHELSHVQNYDIRLMMIVAVFVGTLVFLGDWFFRSRLWGFRSRDRDERSVHPALAIAGVALLILSPIIAQLMQFAISRRREFLADASAVLLTRYAEGLASALKKIRDEQLPVATANAATAHLYLANPLSRRQLKTLFSTHPSIDERIQILERM